MNKLFSILLFASIILINSGCSGKQYYEPEDTFSYDGVVEDLESDIIDLNSDGATLEENEFISKKGILKNPQNGYKFLNIQNNIILAANNEGSLYIKKDKEGEKVLTFDKNIISASILDNILAFSTIDNAITLYNIDTKQTLFKEYLKQSSVNNIKIANPLFLNNLVLYPTLDGKVVIVDINNKNVVKTLNIDPNSDVNNIIFLEKIGDSLVAATNKKIFTFVDGRPNIKDKDVQNIIVHNDNIYVATLDGEVIKYNKSLQELGSKKFKFAKILALAFGTKLYALESQEYLIQIDEDFKEVKVFDFSFDEEEKVIAIDNKIYFEDEYIEVK